jgi:transposase
VPPARSGLRRTLRDRVRVTLMRRSPRSPALWSVSDPLWERMKAVLDEQGPPPAKGRPRVDLRRVVDGILFRLRTGCRWNHIPAVYGSDSTIHRYFLDWCRSGVFEQLWALILEECPDLSSVTWRPPHSAGAGQAPGSPDDPSPPATPNADPAD